MLKKGTILPVVLSQEEVLLFFDYIPSLKYRAALMTCYGAGLRAGESLVVDLYPRGRLFADCTRTFCVGEPPEALARAHALVRSARRRGPPPRPRPACAAGTSRSRLRPLRERGLPDPDLRARHHPRLRPQPRPRRRLRPPRAPHLQEGLRRRGVLREGDVFTLEPGLYDPEAGWAVRIEDLVHLGPDGLGVLTPLPYELDPRAWG